ncbi:2-succinyl-5-enolpyruvyl-6-hydroxy-3-cyclohexene-1-carboxylate synthase, partial [Lactococcus petauri]|nr:2-succinyl-5-enolpyruvyl-6-hydroxy-3-cyclohexene-1-carboxylate synthase [Lactococcus petauri]
SVELSHPNANNLWTYPRQVAQRAYMASTNVPAAAVQINVPIGEPLIPELNPEHYQKVRKPFSLSQGKIQPQLVPE